jgi:hypothetical protein
LEVVLTARLLCVVAAASVFALVRFRVGLAVRRRGTTWPAPAR